ncbi:MAG TPA: xanthine dehydrogenase, partial [Rhodospirillales bacterium]|nr:xanthine dehydrogenase [Rhodospirillales bacterium]
IIGAVAIAQALAPMARIAGFDVTLIDPRPTFATEQRFPHCRIMQTWPDKAMAALKPDRNTAIVTLTHDAAPDDMALDLALKSDVFYMGALGSRKTHASRCQRLTEMGWSDEDLAAICGPIGLDIAAATPAEIAVAILAQVIAAKNR